MISGKKTNRHLPSLQRQFTDANKILDDLREALLTLMLDVSETRNT